MGLGSNDLGPYLLYGRGIHTEGVELPHVNAGEHNTVLNSWCFDETKLIKLMHIASLTK